MQTPVSRKPFESRVSGALARVLSVVPVLEKTTDTPSEEEENTHAHHADEQVENTQLPQAPQGHQSPPASIQTSPTGTLSDTA